ncbi:unnamed protein product, partial [Ectocarpus sp. 8 AP-2014]
FCFYKTFFFFSVKDFFSIFRIGCCGSDDGRPPQQVAGSTVVLRLPDPAATATTAMAHDCGRPLRDFRKHQQPELSGHGYFAYWLDATPQEWKRGYAVMEKGGWKAIQGLFESSGRAAKNGPKNVPGLAKKVGGGARGGRVVGTGNGRNTAVQERQHQHAKRGAGRLWSPADANESHHQHQQQKHRPLEGRAPLPLRGIRQGQGRSLLPIAGMHQQQQQHAHYHQQHRQEQQQKQQQPFHHANGSHHHLRYQ